MRVVVERMHAALSIGGWLFVGHAEPSQSIFYKFQVHNFPGAIVYQKPEHESQAQALPPLPLEWASKTSKEMRDETSSRPLANSRALPEKPIQAKPKPASQAPAAKPRPQRLPPPAELLAAVALFDAGQVDAALAKLASQVEGYPQNAWPPYWLAKIYANRLDLENAERWIDIALAREPLLAPAHYLRGLILQELGRLEQSLEALRRCLFADPEFLLGYFSLAGLYGRLSQPQKALKALMNLEELLAGYDREAVVAEGDGMTVGRLSEFVTAQKELLE